MKKLTESRGSTRCACFATAASILFGLLVHSAHAADAYPIRLSWPSHVGDVVRVSVRASCKHSVKWTDAVNQPVDIQFSAALEGTETIDAVSNNGRATKVTVKVDRCTKDGNNLLPAGTTISADHSNSSIQYKINGADPTKEQKQVLENLLSPAAADESTEDQKVGTDKPQRVGDSWPVNRAALAKAAERLPFHVSGNDFQGEAKPYRR
jgi:hypothetical protein